MKVPFVKEAYRGSVPINWFPAADDDTEVMMYGTPGLGEGISLPNATTVWNMHVMGDYLYVVAQTSETACTLFQVDKAFNIVTIGSVTARHGPIGMVNNGTQLLITHGSNGYVYDTLPKLWVADTTYQAQIYVRPSTPNGYYYKCTVAGTSGAIEPDWDIQTLFYGSAPGTWAASTGYTSDSWVKPTVSNGFYYKAQNAGTSDDIEPTWPTVSGELIADNDITWKTYPVDVGIDWLAVPEAPIYSQITDVNFLGGQSCAFQDGYGIVVQADSRFWQVSSLYDFTTYDADAQAAKEGSDDNIVAVIADHLNIWLFGERTTEIWYNAGATPFPFLRLAGTFIEKGIGAAASLTKGDNSLFWLTNEGQIVRSVGYQAKIISTRKFDRDISKYSRIDDAIGYFYVMEGHAFYDLHFPEANVTWSYDVVTEMMHQKSSYPGTSRHRGNCYVLYNNVHFLGDHSNGGIISYGMDMYTDSSTPIKAILESNQISDEGKRIRFPDMQIIFDHGKEVPADYYYDQDNIPHAMLAWSKDGGRTFPTEVWEPIGQVGEYDKRTIFRELGSDFKRTYRLMVSAPICRNILSVSFLK